MEQREDGQGGRQRSGVGGLELHIRDARSRLRGILSTKIGCSENDDPVCVQQRVDFWKATPSEIIEQRYHEDWADAAQVLDFFCSHVWDPPEEWSSWSDEEYFKVKAVQLKNLLQSRSSKVFGDFEHWEQRLWVDKASSPQAEEEVNYLKKYNFFFIENILLCDNMLVLMSPNYFKVSAYMQHSCTTCCMKLNITPPSLSTPHPTPPPLAPLVHLRVDSEDFLLSSPPGLRRCRPFHTAPHQAR
jgi:hypothetical protein